MRGGFRGVGGGGGSGLVKNGFMTSFLVLKKKNHQQRLICRPILVVCGVYCSWNESLVPLWWYGMARWYGRWQCYQVLMPGSRAGIGCVECFDDDVMYKYERAERSAGRELAE